MLLRQHQHRAGDRFAVGSLRLVSGRAVSTRLLRRVVLGLHEPRQLSFNKGLAIQIFYCTTTFCHFLLLRVGFQCSLTELHPHLWHPQ